MKPLSKCDQDDNVICEVLSTAVNQDGRSANLTSPNGLSQEAVIQSALNRAGMEPSKIDFVETHGTGTKLGNIWIHVQTK